MEKFLLLLVFVGESHALFPVAAETKCNVTQTTSPCSSIVGGSAYIRLLENATGYKIRCYKDDLNVFSLKRGQLMVEEEYKYKIEFLVGTGMLKINNVKRTDSGQYIVEGYDPNGRRKDIYFNLQVKENIFLILNSVRFAVVVLLTAVLFCCMCSKLNLCGDSGGNQANDENLFKMYQTPQRE